MHECIEGSGSLNNRGYYQVMTDNGQMLAHRHVWEQAHGQRIPKGGVVRHTCDNKRCVNPAHLLLGTTSDNVRDAVERKLHRNSRKTHCPQGHEYTADNTYTNPNTGWRMCRMCRAEHSKVSEQTRPARVRSKREKVNT